MSRPQKSKRPTGKGVGRKKRKPNKRLRNMLGETLVTGAGVVKGLPRIEQ